jgi:hypothetical protein
MKKEDKPRRKRPAEESNGPASSAKGEVASREQPAASERTRDDVPGPDDKTNSSPKSENPSQEEIISAWRKPVTNQDEQEKITNAGSDDIPIANE